VCVGILIKRLNVLLCRNHLERHVETFRPYRRTATTITIVIIIIVIIIIITASMNVY
jgi:t-SNARE complex subunit (syntaxin)